jgi:hypothetical protein
MDNSVRQNQQAQSIENMQIKIPNNFTPGTDYIPIGKQTEINGKSTPAIPDFISLPPGGNWIAISANGTLDFIKIPGVKSILTTNGGLLNFVPVAEGDLSLFNNELGWTATKACE